VPEALAKFDTPPNALTAFLGCTHYGYQSGVFETLLRDHVDRSIVLNPNRDAATEILGRVDRTTGTGAIEVRFVSPYPIPEKPLQSLPHYLGGKSPATVAALRSFDHDPSLYGSK
jgi:hypothetical protein